MGQDKSDTGLAAEYRYTSLGANPLALAVYLHQVVASLSLGGHDAGSTRWALCPRWNPNPTAKCFVSGRSPTKLGFLGAQDRLG